jgi:hypothetical protein
MEINLSFGVKVIMTTLSGQKKRYFDKGLSQKKPFLNLEVFNVKYQPII